MAGDYPVSKAARTERQIKGYQMGNKKKRKGKKMAQPVVVKGKKK